MTALAPASSAQGRLGQSGLIRFQRAVDLSTGEAVWAYAESMRRFEDCCMFGRGGDEIASGADWLARLIEDVAARADALDMRERPIVLPAPATLILEDDAPAALDAAIARTRLCPQEICLELPDAAAAAQPCATRRWADATRKIGVRVALDASRSADAAFDKADWLLLDSLRVTAEALFVGGHAAALAMEAADSGVSVLADRPRWSDVESLARFGVRYALRPTLDS